MSWCWLVRTDAVPEGAVAAAELSSGGHLSALAADRPAPSGKRKIDARALNSEGEPALASLVLPPDGLTITFDDLAVSGAMRAALAAPWPHVLSTLVVDSSRFAGALTAVRNGDRGRLEADPFARIFPAEIVEIGPGLLGRTPAPTGPVIQRYGGGNPWPWDRF
ncbi:MAG: hypothetical protein H0W14_12075 [Actinobacteria bacterium]|nr:hypothetical protein [Actinomycetota bacterium]